MQYSSPFQSYKFSSSPSLSISKSSNERCLCLQLGENLENLFFLRWPGCKKQIICSRTYLETWWIIVYRNSSLKRLRWGQVFWSIFYIVLFSRIQEYAVKIIQHSFYLLFRWLCTLHWQGGPWASYCPVTHIKQPYSYHWTCDLENLENCMIMHFHHPLIFITITLKSSECSKGCK